MMSIPQECKEEKVEIMEQVLDEKDVMHAIDPPLRQITDTHTNTSGHCILE